MVFSSPPLILSYPYFLKSFLPCPRMLPDIVDLPQLFSFVFVVCVVSTAHIIHMSRFRLSVVLFATLL